jgi:hypothetical protein
MIFVLILLGGYAGGLAARGVDRETAAIMGSLGVAMAGAGAWLLATRVVRRRW